VAVAVLGIAMGFGQAYSAAKAAARVVVNGPAEGVPFRGCGCPEESSPLVGLGAEEEGAVACCSVGMAMEFG
jgi:hypothetical protein